MLPLDGFHVEVDGTSFGIAADGSVAGVGKWAGLAVAEASNIIFIAAEVLLFGCSVGRHDFSYEHNCKNDEGWGNTLELEGTKLLVYNLPDNLIRSHDRRVES